MQSSLAQLIAQFTAAQKRAVKVLTEELGIRRPTSSLDWLKVQDECGLQDRKQLGPHKIFSHGFGVEICLGDVTVDFDWGDHGEDDGFDAWRLWYFILTNKLPYSYSGELEIKKELAEALAAGELAKDRCLYYLKK